MSAPSPERRDDRPDSVRPAVLAVVVLLVLGMAAAVLWALRPEEVAPVVEQAPAAAPSRVERPGGAPSFTEPPAVEARAEPVPDEPGGEGPSGMLLHPPNVKPILRGLVVPEDFVLPPGYVRHLQANADGTLLAPILTFHPDYQPLDDAGRPVALGEGRVVPPELAPPGFPLKVLEVPTPDFTDREDPGADGGG